MLKAIEQHGSISKAAKAMEMSYKKAWRMVNSMNKEGAELLVVAKTGGTNGGGTVLSDAGKKAIEMYDQLCEENTTQLNNSFSKLDM